MITDFKILFTPAYDTDVTLECSINANKYPNGKLRLEVLDNSDGLRIGMATVSIPEIELAYDEIIVNEKTEMAGILDALVKAEIVERPALNRWCENGFVRLPICKLTNKFFDEIEDIILPKRTKSRVQKLIEGRAHIKTSDNDKE